ncbi:transcription elongation regulator 1-like protein isoform X2 [Ornithorhynchus anatinus]|uniref:transcription elongation regulator 1-like protein isoform X2 n=1 Tax=Ornithorhynchus anatinus TaxID=9258 RepID=UPI0010A7EDD1|nr:transcription elongation regulator 1-like protein isoform X2 [Ornithorhynchus anatinus]
MLEVPGRRRGRRGRRGRRAPQGPEQGSMEASGLPLPCLVPAPTPGPLVRLGAGAARPDSWLLSAAHPASPSPAPRPAAALLPGVTYWPLPCPPFLPLGPGPAGPDLPLLHPFPLIHGQWMFGTHSPALAYSPSSNVELIPIFPTVYSSTPYPPAGKSWMEQRIPNCKIYFNNAFALDSAWTPPEESRPFQGREMPHLFPHLAVAITSSAPTARPLPAVRLTPQSRAGGGQNGIKPAGINPPFAATPITVEPERLEGPSATNVPPCHVLTLAPIRIPLLASPLAGSPSRIESCLAPLLPAQLARVTAISAPAVRFVTTDLVEPRSADKGKESSRASCPSPLILHTERTSHATENEEKECSLLGRDANSSSKGNKPVASTPVPGSPWCVVWTGDDRVFFFNPTMQLSVWEKPTDLKNRGDINRILEDPPHKRKLEPSARNSGDSSSEDVNEDQNLKTKRNRLEDSPDDQLDPLQAEEKAETTPPRQLTFPLEERLARFRDMLLERGVSAFSTWEKELHKIVFDPRYLLLNSDERKQVFEQFVKTRIKEEYKEKKGKFLLAKEEFKKLLEESKLSPRTTFKEFAEKYGRDQRFRLLQKKKDQEHFFNQFMHSLKRRDKENRIRLRKMR